MKAFRIKKRSHKVPTYIAGEPVAKFKKPKLPRKLFFRVNKPTLYKSTQIIFKQ